MHPLLLKTIIKIYLLYWIIIHNWISSFHLLFVFSCFDFYIIYIYNIRFDLLSLLLVLIILLVSSCVIINLIEYITIMDIIGLLFFIMLFLFSMISFVSCYDLIIIFLNRDMLGLISYLLINHWSSKLNCGIKAIIYNRIGDCSFLLVLSFSFVVFSGINYYLFIPLLLLLFIFILFNWFNSSFLLYFVIFIIIFTKSAQLPFSSRLLNSMIAPTPISALLHSSTMVVAGVISGIKPMIIFVSLIGFYGYFILILFYYMFIIMTLIWSLLRALFISDIKLLIALSTISQISYMFFVLLINPIICIFHIIIHALFKSLLFLVSGSIIHINNNYQSIYKLRNHTWNNDSLIKISLFVVSSVLILSQSKEAIIHSLNYYLSFNLLFIIIYIGGILTTIYTIKIIFIFIYFSFFFYFILFYYILLYYILFYYIMLFCFSGFFILFILLFNIYSSFFFFIIILLIIIFLIIFIIYCFIFSFLYYSFLFFFILLISIFIDQLIYSVLFLDSIFINYYNESLLCYYFCYSLEFSLLFFILLFLLLFFIFCSFYFYSWLFNPIIRTQFNSVYFLFFIPLFVNNFLLLNCYFIKGYINFIEIINNTNCSYSLFIIFYFSYYYFYCFLVFIILLIIVI